MPLTTHAKLKVKQELLNQLPEKIEVNDDKITIRTYEMDELAEFCYNIYNRGLKEGRESAKRTLKKSLNKAINKILINS